MKNARPRTCKHSWAGVFGCSGRSRELPILESTEVRASRAVPHRGLRTNIYHVRAKRVLDFGYVRANGELMRPIPCVKTGAALLSAPTSCTGECHRVVWCLRCALRSVMAVSPACPAFCSALRHCPRVPVGGAGVIFDAPALRSSYQVFFACKHAGCAASLFICT